MKKWLSGVRGTVAMILTWTVGWGLGFGGLMELYDPLIVNSSRPAFEKRERSG